jgi:hypothetical protein
LLRFIVSHTMAGRNLGETTVAWLERLLLSGAKEYEINAVREILAAERLPTPAGKFITISHSVSLNKI